MLLNASTAPVPPFILVGVSESSAVVVNLLSTGWPMASFGPGSNILWQQQQQQH